MVPYRQGDQGRTDLPADTRRRTMLLQIAGGVIAGALALATVQYMLRPRPGPAIAGSTWGGSIGNQYQFRLYIDTVESGHVEGTMEWPGWGTTKVKGTLDDHHLQLVDVAVVSGGVPIGDKKDLIINAAGDEMDGTDKDGAMKMHASRVIR